MKLFVDRHKTLLPRVDMIYFFTRILVLIGIGWFGFQHSKLNTFTDPYVILLVTYALFAVYFYIAVIGRLDIKLAYFSSIIYDLILLPFLILSTGSPDSAFSLLYFLTISVAAYVLTFWFSLAIVIMVSVSYMILSLWMFSHDNIFDDALKVFFYWVDFMIVLYASEYIRKSEKRLLKLLNTLNMRTSELEKSQAHLETVYENTRVIASILDTDSLVNEVMRLMGKLMQFQAYAIIFRDKKHNYYYRAKKNSEGSNFHLKALDINKNDLLRLAAVSEEPIVVKDMSSREDYQPLNESSRALIIAPMTLHGQANGFLIAEDNHEDYFKDFDIQMLSAVARSAALALENAALHKRTEELSVIDELTGSYNYRYFVQKLDEEKRRTLRYELPLSLLMVDIDHFKKLNDTFGHETGNRILSKLSGVIRECIRDVDIFARYGGEEFAVILPQTPSRVAHVIAERIRKKVEETVFLSEKNHKIRLTVSVGLSSFPENGMSQEELVSVADEALYRAKGEGRNQVCVK